MASSNIDFSTKYSLSSLLNNLLRVNQNSLEIINKLSDITSSDADTVEIDVIDENNTIRKVYVPSYGKISSEITRLDNNVKQLAGIGESNGNVQLEDGTFRKLLLSNLELEGKPITNMASPTTFQSKTNWFFESFLNPLLYVSFDFTGQIPADTERCKVQRFILNLNTQAQRNVWKNSINSISNLDYVNFFQLLLQHNITYFLDEDVIDMPPRDIRYYGNFTVLRIFDDQVTSQVDGVNWTKRKFRIELNTLNYNDVLSEYQKTQQLKVGDSLVITGDNTQNNTRYQITNIDEDTGNIIEAKLIEGFDTVAIGTTLSFYSPSSAPVELDVNVGFNEYTVVFVKAINPLSKIPSLEWSPGVAFYTNNLEIIDPDGNQLTLEEYYKEQVVDFGTYLYNMAKDGIPPATLAVTPSTPVISSSDFVVSQINSHLTDVSRINKIKNLQTEKISLQSELDSLNNSVKTKRADMNTKRYTSQSQRDTDQAELNDLINRSSSASTLLKSAVDEVIALADSDNLEGITPKYRVKGFWPVPDPVASPRTAPQSVIQFRIQYRYVAKEGGANQPEQITFKDNTGVERRGTFSTWTELLTPVRLRTVSSDGTGQYVWVTENVENADTVNFNQVEIPIKENEAVEIRMKSISEAGWPANPAESSWATVVKVDFPDDLIASNEIVTIVANARLTSESLEITNTLNDTGVTQHISEQFTQNETFYAHTANGIASGFLTDEQNVVNLFEKLSDFDLRIRLIEEAITGEKGKLQVRILTADNAEYPVKNNSLLKLFAGNYKSDVKDLQPQKGVIVAKNYVLQLTNINASPLELYAREYGTYTQIVNSTTSGGTGFDVNATDYNTSRRYDVVPLGPSNLSPNDILAYNQFIDLPYQSGQVKGQFINTRYESVDGTVKLYEDVFGSVLIPGPTVSATLPANALNNFPAAGAALDNYTEHEYNLSSLYNTTLPGAGSTTAGEFVWAGTYEAPLAPGASPQTVPTSMMTAAIGDGIYVHKLHPMLQGPTSEWGTIASVAGPGATSAAGPTGVRNSGFAPLQSTDIISGSQKQAAYFYFDPTVTPSGKNGYVSKMSFEVNDQYLLGVNSCGSYLYLSPTNNTGGINVNGSNKLSQRLLEFGNQYAINIPIVFQYRMTDFFGDGDTGIGNIGGDPSGVTNQLEYTKRLGIDIYSNIDERFSFDVEITARYRSASLQLEEVPTQDLVSVVNDLTRTVRILNPRISGVNSKASNLNINSQSSLLGSID